MPPTLAIIGRPNVGKSTLFNRLVGRRIAIVHDQPGVTRDWRQAAGRLFDLAFELIDTAGLEGAAPESLAARMTSQTERALARTDLAILLYDARAGVTAGDRHFANWLRRSGKATVLVANKCEGRSGEGGRLEGFDLGLGEPIPVSAEHGEGLSDLRDALLTALPGADWGNAPLADEVAEREGKPDSAVEDEEDGEETRTLRLAVVGRPNVGKSTLVNKLLGEERLLTGPEAGITRDAILVPWSYRGQPVELVDTAGLRRRARVTDGLERLAAADSRRALDLAQVVILVVDAAAPLEKQDLTVASEVAEEGRALVLAVNKWDACGDRDIAIGKVRDRLERSLPQVRGLPVVPISALQGQNLDRLMEAVFSIYRTWNRRISTADLNRWLAVVGAAHPPPAPGGRALKLKYLVQTKTRPPTGSWS
ncbi:MAG: ribosome biogenesis GTPase Der, partial [Geminicoccales bacterium]